MHSRMLSTRSFVVAAALLAVVLGADPDPPRQRTPPSAITSVGSKKLADTRDCSGAVAFSGVGLAAAAPKPSSGPLTFKGSITDRGIGWSAQSGEFTCFCPGLYQLAFAARGDAQIILKKKANNGSNWTPVLATGPKGGSNVALLDLEIGDKVAVFLESGVLESDPPEKPVNTFSGFRIAKK